jgi:hypothetical protein
MTRRGLTRIRCGICKLIIADRSASRCAELMRDHRRIAHPVSRAVRRLVSEISTARTVTP